MAWDESPPSWAEAPPDSKDQPGPFRTAFSTLVNNLPVAPGIFAALANPEAAKSFGKGALSGATFGLMGKPDSVIPGANPHPDARKVGRVAGTLLPLALAAETGGATLGMAGEAAGSGIFGQAALEGAGTGMTFEGMKGAATGRNPLETINKAAETGLTFAGFGAADAGLGYLRNALGNDVAEKLMNHFLATDRKIAMKLTEQGKSSVGETVLKTTDLPGFKNRQQVYDQAGQELGFTEDRIQGRLPDVKGDIPVNDVASALDNVASKFDTGTHSNEVARVQKIKDEFLKRHSRPAGPEGVPENTISIQDAMTLKRKLDDRVNTAYLAESGAKLPVAVEADEALANALRAKIYEIDPVLGDLAAKESLMLKVRTSLSPKVAKSGDAHILSGFYRTIVNALEGTRFTNAAAKGISSIFGQPSQTVGPLTRMGAKAAVAQPEE